MANGPDPRAGRLYAGVSALLAGVYVWHSLLVHYVSDDGFISMQYAKNLLRGNGLVYNPGERVEGYTNFLWVVLIAGARWLWPGSSLPDVAQALGVVCGAVTILLVCRFAWIVWGRRRWFGLLAGAFLACHSGFAAWGTGGLETTLLALLLFVAASTYVSFLRTGRRLLGVPFWFALATMTRPDAGALFAVTAGHAFVRERRRGVPLRRTRLAGFALVFAVVYLPYFAWRLSYYGYPLPNTFYAKVGSGIHQYLRGAGYLLGYAWTYGAVVFVPALLLLLRRPREAWRDYLALLVGTYGACIVYVGGDGLAFYRFVAFVAPLIYLLVAEGLADLYERAARWPMRPAWLRPAALGAAVTACLLLTAQQSLAPLVFPERHRWYEPQSGLSFPILGSDHPYRWFDNYFVDRQAAAARWLEAHAPADAVVASTPAGSIAFHLDRLRVIDMLGLNDTHIAHGTAPTGQGRAGHEKGDGRYVLSRAPDYILLGNVAVLPEPLSDAEMPGKLVQKSEREIWAAPEFHQRYERVTVKLDDRGVLRYFTFFRRKPAVATAPAGWVGVTAGGAPGGILPGRSGGRPDARSRADRRGPDPPRSRG